MVFKPHEIFLIKLKYDLFFNILGRALTSPECYAAWTVDHPVGLLITEGEEKLDEDIYEEGQLPDYVQRQKLRWQTSEEPEFQRREEGRVGRPNEYKIRPQMVIPS